MKQMKRTFMAVALASAVSLTPAANAASWLPMATVYAHGHSSGHHSSSSVSYYYCDGHDAHTHDNGVCPYDSDIYYCNGHDAHTHTNGVCPYASSVSKTTVKKVQKKLNKCGYNCGKVDGVVGTKTKKALKKFQKDNGLKADGVIGPATLAALGL